MAAVVASVEQAPNHYNNRGADAVVSTLQSAGVRVAFGVPGGAISPVFDALLDAPAVQVVSCRHEAAAVFAAAAWARVSQTPAVVLVTSGPGALNLMNALASADADACPVVVLVGEVPTARQGRHALQDGSAHGLDLVHAVSRWTRWAAAVPTASALVPMLTEALERAADGATLLTLPVDLLLESVPRTCMLHGMPPAPSLPDLSGIAAALAGCRSPHILIGGHARGRARAIVALAEKLGAPVATTPVAKGLFAESHPLSLGVFGVGGHPSALRAITEDADGLLVLGSSLDELSTAGFRADLMPDGPVVQVHPDGQCLARSYGVQWGVRAPVAEFVDALIDALPAGAQWSREPRLKRHLPPPSRGLGVHPAAAVRGAQSLMPPDTLWAVDSGEHTFAAMQYLEIDQPEAWYALLGLGSMGAGICGAIGLALAAPHRAVACICGDGGLLMHLGELSTAAQLGLPIRWFVFDDRQLGMVVHGHRALYGRSPDFDHGTVDLAAAAQALGVPSVRVSSPEELAASRALLASVHGPLVVVIDIDPTVQLPKGGRLATLCEAPEPAAQPAQQTQKKEPT